MAVSIPADLKRLVLLQTLSSPTKSTGKVTQNFLKLSGHGAIEYTKFPFQTVPDATMMFSLLRPTPGYIKYAARMKYRTQKQKPCHHWTPTV